MSPSTSPDTVGIHPKVKVPAVVGTILTLATVVAHFAASQSSVPWAYTYGSAAVTVLGAVSGYITPGPVPKVVAQDVAKVADVAALASQLVKQFDDIVQQSAAQPPAVVQVGAGAPAPDTSAAFPDPAGLPPAVA